MANDGPGGDQDYSCLEVVGPTGTSPYAEMPPQYDSTGGDHSWFDSEGEEKSTTSNIRDGYLPEAYRADLQYPIPAVPAPAVVSSSTETSNEAYPAIYGAYEPLKDYGAYAPRSVYSTSPPTEAPRGTGRAGFFGLFRRRTWIIGAVIIVAIIALIGGLAGGLTSRKSDNPDEASLESQGAPGDDEVEQMVESQLAAINFTDSSNNMRRAIFYQVDTCLFLNQYHGNNNTWEAFNISDAFVRDRGGSAIFARPKTPLTAAAIPHGSNPEIPFLISLYFLDENGQVRELTTTDENLHAWEHGNASEAGLYTCTMSQLSAVAQYCSSGDCKQTMCVAFQNKEQYINVACGDDWTAPEQMQTAYPGASLSMVPLAANDSSDSAGTGMSEMRLFYYTDTAIRVRGYLNGQWTSEMDAAITRQMVLNETVPKVVATPSGLDGAMLAVSMEADNTFTSSFYHNDEWTSDQRTSFVNEDGTSSLDSPKDLKFASIAMNQNGSFFGLTTDGSQVIEYLWTAEAPYDFQWKRTIATL